MKKTNKTTPNIPSVNFHLWEPCNMRCKFCFATFQDVKSTVLPKGHLPFEEAKQLVEAIAKFGFKKITFAGGEPTLCPWLPKLVALAKEKKLLTNIVTNGHNLLKKPELLQKLQGITDWITVSIDSFDDSTNIESGRAHTGKKAMSTKDYYQLAQAIEDKGIRFKCNTVVHQMNYQENLSLHMEKLQPERWKIFQVLPMGGQNDEHIDKFTVSSTDFKHFLNNNQYSGTLVPENNDDMTNSYVMIDPAGRFYNNETGKNMYSLPILEQGIATCYEQMGYSKAKFENRDGLYYES